MSVAARFRSNLPQLGSQFFLTEGGIETSLIYQHGIPLPFFAVFPLLEDPERFKVIEDYYVPFLETARRFQTGFVMGSVTWRANRDWGEKLGYSERSLDEINRAAVALCSGLRERWAASMEPIVISACLGPRGDGYRPGAVMTQGEAQDYHERQMTTFEGTPADLVTAASLNYCDEAIGIARAARSVGIPLVESFTLETDGRLPSGESLGEAIRRVDEATDGYVSYFGINCAHPQHFRSVFSTGEPWVDRIRAVRANASKSSHDRLACATTLDRGNPKELGRDYRFLLDEAPELRVLGGCCGTDQEHLEEIALACFSKMK